MIRVIKRPRARSMLFLLLAACWGAATLAWAVSRADQAATETAGTGSSPAIPPQSFLNNLVDMELLDQHGRPFQAEALADRVVLFNFIFTNCGSVCPLQTRVLAETYLGLPEDVRSLVRFVSLSIDPVNDTPEKLLLFSRAMNADVEGWSFLTGDAGQIARLAERLRLFDPSESEENKPQLHRTSLWLVDRQGRMLQRYRGDPPDRQRLARELAQVSHMTID